MKKRIEEEVREIFESMIDVGSPRISTKEGGDDLARKLDRKITEELAVALMSRWLIMAREEAPESSVPTEAFARIYAENKANGEGAIVAIVRLLNDVGAARPPSFPTIGKN